MSTANQVLILVRHGQRMEKANKLSPQGMEQSRNAGSWLVTAGFTHLEYSLVSDTNRTRQTAEALLKARVWLGKLVYAPLLHHDPAQYRALIEHSFASGYSKILLVGHNDTMSYFCNHLLGSHEHLFRLGEVRVLERFCLEQGKSATYRLLGGFVP